MPPKVGAKKPQGRQIVEKPLHPYEEQRLRRCMQNSSRLEQLGIPGLKSMLANICSISHEKETDNNRNREDSESDYDPSHDDDSEGDMIDDSAKGLKGSDRRPAMPPGGPGGIKRRSKRIYPEQETTRATRSKKSIAQPEANLAPSDICFPDPLPSHVNQVQEVGDDGIVLSDGCTTNGGEGITEPRGGISIGGEGLQERRERGVNMGHGLQRINRSRRGKLPVIIQEGRIRPVVPLVAVKFATECNIAVRNHVPVLKHWKDYKKKPEILTMFEGRLSAKFDIKTSEAPVHNACMQMMKKAIRQQRYRLKKKYFDPFPLHLVSKTSPVKSLNDEQWNDLVELWKTPEKMNTCRRMKDNRANVKFHQTTGSRSYMVHVENLGDKYKDHDPDALDLFKECHYSKKKEGYTPAVQLAITEMENKQSTLVEGEQPKSATEVVADVLVENTKKNQFLQNVGIQAARPRSKVQNIEVQLEAEKRDNADLREQMAVLSKKVQETEQARIKEQEEMKRKQAEMDAKLALVLSQIRPN